MQIFLDNDDVLPIYKKILALYISKDFAHLLDGKITTIVRQDSEQTNRRRELLAIEEQAKKDKIIAAHGETFFQEQVSNNLYNKVHKVINNDFDQKEKLFSSVLKVEDAVPAILEILAVKAASVKRLTPLTNSLPWLANDIVALVNKPQYRKRADVKVHDPNLALSYIGLDNLKLVMPTFMLKHWLPASTAPFPLLKRKLWNEAFSMGLATQTLAKHQQLDTFTAFTTAMFSNMGYMAVSQVFLNRFASLLEREIRQAFDSKDKRLHTVLMKMSASPDILLEQLSRRACGISAEMVEQMSLDRLTITEPVFDLAYTPNVENMSPYAQISLKAFAYVMFRSLTRESLIDKTEAKLLFSAVNLSANEIRLLKSTDIDHLKLNFN